MESLLFCSIVAGNTTWSRLVQWAQYGLAKKGDAKSLTARVASYQHQHSEITHGPTLALNRSPGSGNLSDI